MIRYKKLHDVAQRFETWLSLRERKRMPNRNHIEQFFCLNLVSLEYIGRGAFKNCYRISKYKQPLVLKIGRRIAVDCETINDARSRGMKRHVAKVYWHTEHCMLQKGATGEATPEQIKKLKGKAWRRGLVDVRKANVGTLPCGRAVVYDLNRSERKTKES